MLNEFIWDGTMDYGWEDLSKLLVNTCHKFTEIMLNTTEISPNAESRELITSNCMERFKGIAGILADIIRDGLHYAYEDLEGETENALKLNAWIRQKSGTRTRDGIQTQTFGGLMLIDGIGIKRI